MAFFEKLFNKSQKPGNEAGVNAAPAQPAAPQAVAKQEEKKPAPSAAALEFGAWLAIKGSTKEEIARTLGLKQPASCEWAEGVRQSQSSSTHLFVTEEVEGFHLVIGSALPDLAYRTKAMTWITDLSGFFPAVYAFVAQKNVQVYGFAQAEDAALYRIYAVAQGAVRINKGDVSDGEEALNMRLPENDDELFDGVGVTVPSEECIRALAAYWSVDPGTAHGTKGICGQVEKI